MPKPSTVELLTAEQQERFWSRVNKAGPMGCWVWIGVLSSGYGRAGILPIRNAAVHRVSWELLRGRIPDGLVLDHICRNRACVNPDHLEVVTERENIRRGVSRSGINARKQTCKRGHPLSGDNLLVYRSGARQCRICKTAAWHGRDKQAKREYDQKKWAWLHPKVST